MSEHLASLTVDKRALKATIICCTILIFKCVAANGMMGAKRFKAGSRPPEDKSLFPKFGDQKFSTKVASESDNAK